MIFWTSSYCGVHNYRNVHSKIGMCTQKSTNECFGGPFEFYRLISLSTKTLFILHFWNVPYSLRSHTCATWFCPRVRILMRSHGGHFRDFRVHGILVVTKWVTSASLGSHQVAHNFLSLQKSPKLKVFTTRNALRLPTIYFQNPNKISENPTFLACLETVWSIWDQK